MLDAGCWMLVAVTSIQHPASKRFFSGKLRTLLLFVGVFEKTTND
jgi:hypothetical protein